MDSIDYHFAFCNLQFATCNLQTAACSLYFIVYLGTSWSKMELFQASSYHLCDRYPDNPNPNWNPGFQNAPSVGFLRRIPSYDGRGTNHYKNMSRVCTEKQNMGIYSSEDVHIVPNRSSDNSLGFDTPEELKQQLPYHAQTELLTPVAIVNGEQLGIGPSEESASEQSPGCRLPQGPICPSAGSDKYIFPIPPSPDIRVNSELGYCASGEGSGSCRYGKQTAESSISPMNVDCLSSRILAQSLGGYGIETPSTTLWSQTTTSGETNTHISGLKRSRDLASESGDDDWSEHRGKRPGCEKQEFSCYAGIKLYACPYYLRYRDDEMYAPTGIHRACKNGTLKVKDHILRVHLKPAQCLTCGVRGDRMMIDKHTKNANCSSRYDFERASRQTKLLNEKLTSQREMSWAQIWTLLFKDTAAIPEETEQTIFIGPQLKELEEAMSNFLRPMFPLLAQKLPISEDTTQHPRVIYNEGEVVAGQIGPHLSHEPNSRDGAHDGADNPQQKTL